MVKPAVRYLAVAAIGAALTVPAQSQNRIRHESLNFNVSDNNAEHCSDLKVDSSGEIAHATEAFTLSRAEAPVLQIDAPDHGNVRVLGAAQSEYSVEVCKFAVAVDRATAEQALVGITVSHSGGRLSASGPPAGAHGDDGQWMSYFIVHAPKDAPVTLEARNGPISVRGIDGEVKVNAVNGPVALRDLGGRVEASTINGPIAFEGSSGDIHLKAQNGPIAVKISGDFWNGNQLEVSTNNGPLSLKIPDTFQSGVRLEMSGNSPMSCRASICDHASEDLNSRPRVIQMMGSSGAIRISTHNGPVSVGGSDTKLKKII